MHTWTLCELRSTDSLLQLRALPRGQGTDRRRDCGTDSCTAHIAFSFFPFLIGSDDSTSHIAEPMQVFDAGQVLPRYIVHYKIDPRPHAPEEMKETKDKNLGSRTSK